MSTSPDQTYTLDDFVNAKPSSEISYDSLSIYELIDQTYMISHNILDDYKPEIMSAVKSVKLSNDEFNKYYQSPQLLAFDIYGSCELDYMILFVNGMYDMKQFKKQTINLLSATVLTEVLSEIYKANQKTLTANKNSIPTSSS